MTSGIRVAATVIMYNSYDYILENIETYYSQVEKIYLIDNSDTTLIHSTLLFRNLSKVQYIHSGGNKGVAVALNTAATLAMSEGFDYLLTMDDDSQAPLDMVSDMTNYLKQSGNIDLIGIVSGVHSSRTYSGTNQAVPYTMTSGNLLNLTIYKQLGSFREDFFIDHIDHEYGLRLNRKGFLVIELLNIQLQHRLGERKASGWGTYQFISHSPIRGYYMTRNGCVLARSYPEFRIKAMLLISKEWLKVLLFENHKVHRLQLLWRGLYDAWRGHLGKFDG